MSLVHVAGPAHIIIYSRKVAILGQLRIEYRAIVSAIYYQISIVHWLTVFSGFYWIQSGEVKFTITVDWCKCTCNRPLVLSKTINKNWQRAIVRLFSTPRPSKKHLLLEGLAQPYYFWL